MDEVLYIEYKTPGEYKGCMQIKMSGFLPRASQRDFKQLLRIIRFDLREDEHLEKLKDYLQDAISTLKKVKETDSRKQIYDNQRRARKFEKFLSMMQ